MKKKFPIPLLIAGLLFFIVKDQLFKKDQVKQLTKYSLVKEKPMTYNSSNQIIDTNSILNNLCEKTIIKKFDSSEGLNVIISVPCSWKENFTAEKSGAASSYSEIGNYGIKQMALVINEIDKNVSDRELTDVFSSENLKKSADAVNAITYQKFFMAGLDCVEMIFKQNGLTEAPEYTFYVVHFETIFRDKFITLSYTVGNTDSTKSNKDFYQFLPVFRTLAKKW